VPMTQFVTHLIIPGLVPLQDPKPGEDAPYIPPVLQQYFFRPDAENATPQYTYAVLDGAKITFLPDMLAASGLEYASLYEGMEFASKYDPDEFASLVEAGPWLVQLKADAALTRHFFADNPENPDGHYLLARDAGILLKSVWNLPDLQAHLRKFIRLPDEEGINIFFRFYEPGMLDAALSVADAGQVAELFSGLTALWWLRPSMRDNRWDAIRVTPAPETATIPGKPWVLDKPMRAAIRWGVSVLRGRKMARAHTGDIAEREARAITYARLMELGFDNDFWLGTTHDQLGQIPAADRPEMWRMIESGDYSLGPFNVMIAKRYGLHLDLEW